MVKKYNKSMPFEAYSREDALQSLDGRSKIVASRPTKNTGNVKHKFKLSNTSRPGCGTIAGTKLGTGGHCLQDNNCSIHANGNNTKANRSRDSSTRHLQTCDDTP